MDGICSVIYNARTLLESDFCCVFQDQIKLGFPSIYLDQAYIVLVSSIEERKLAANKTEKHMHIYLNNAESAVEYIARLQSSIEADLASIASTT